MPREYSRHLRVGAELSRVLNQLLQTEVKDPRLAGVHISDVDLSADLGVAKVYFSMLQPDDDPEGAEEAFTKARGFLRGRIGREVKLRRVPELRFICDESARRGLEISQLIDSIQSGPDDGDA